MITSSSAELREWAARCEDNAATATDEAERASLLRKCEALRALADQEDWLAGLPSGAGPQHATGTTLAPAELQQAAE